MELHRAIIFLFGTLLSKIKLKYCTRWFAILLNWFHVTRLMTCNIHLNINCYFTKIPSLNKFSTIWFKFFNWSKFILYSMHLFQSNIVQKSIRINSALCRFNTNVIVQNEAKVRSCTVQVKSILTARNWNDMNYYTTSSTWLWENRTG